MKTLKNRIVVLCAALLLAVGGVGVSTPQEASAHNYGYWYDCYNGNVSYYQHVYVQYGFDWHKHVLRSMTYNEWVYQCGGW